MSRLAVRLRRAGISSFFVLAPCLTLVSCLGILAAKAQTPPQVEKKAGDPPTVKDLTKGPRFPSTRSATEPAARSELGFWMDRHKVLLDRVKPGRAGLLFVGDSITQGWEGPGRDVWRRFYTPRDAVNLGIGGDRTQHVLWRLDNGELDGVKPKAVVVLIGTNNLSTNAPEEIAEGIKLIIKKLREKLPGTPVLLMGIFPRSLRPEDPFREKLRAVNAIVAKLADGKNVRYLDIGSKFLEPDGTIARSTMPDGLHLTAKGYRIWADAIEPTLWEMTEGK